MYLKMKLSSAQKEHYYSWLGLVLLLAGLVICFVWLPFTISGDGEDRYQFMYTLINEHRIAPMRYSMIGPLVSWPIWRISFYFKDPTAVVERYNSLLLVAFLAGFALVIKKQFTWDFLLTFSLLLAFGSMFPAHLINYYGEVFSSVCLAAGLAGLALNKYWIGWALVLLGVLNTPALLIPFGLVVLYSVWDTKKLRYLALILLAVSLLVAESYLRTGSIKAGFQTYITQDHGYQTALPYSGKTGFSYPFGFGLISILFSFGKGLIFYCPGLVLTGLAWKRITNPTERKLLTLWLLAGGGLILVYASWWAWYGGWFWGPRFFLFTSIPASWILARLAHSQSRSFWQTAIYSAILSFSLWVGINGVVFQQKTLDLCTKKNYSLEAFCWYVPEFSALFRPFVTHKMLQFSDWLLLFTFLAIWLYLAIPHCIELARWSFLAGQRALPILKSYRWRI